MISQRTFPPKVFQAKLGIALSLVMLVPIGIFTKSIWDGTAHFLQPVFLSFLIFFLVFTLSSMRKLSKQLKSGISVSDQGLWPSHLSPESSLVPWQKVAVVRERPRGQALELLDSSGQRLLALSLALVDFDQLQELLASRLHANRLTKPQGSKELPVRFALSPLASLGPFAAVAAGLGIIAYSLWLQPPDWVGVGIGVLELTFCMWLAMETSLGLEVERSSLTLRYLFRSRRVFREEIDSVSCGHSLGNFPCVTLKLKDGAVFHLKFSSIEALELKMLLDSWLEQA